MATKLKDLNPSEDNIREMFTKTQDNFESLEVQGGTEFELNRLDKQKAEQADLDLLKAQVKNLTANPGSATEGNAELLDIRIGADGKAYGTAGEAVRRQAVGLQELSEILASADWTYLNLEFSDGGFDSNYNPVLSNYHMVHSNKFKVGSKLLIDCSRINPSDYKLYMYGTDITRKSDWIYNALEMHSMVTDVLRYYQCMIAISTADGSTMTDADKASIKNNLRIYVLKPDYQYGGHPNLYLEEFDDWVEDKYISNSGREVANHLLKHRKIDVSEVSHIRYSFVVNNIVQEHPGAFFDADQHFICSLPTASNSADGIHFVADVPATAKYLEYNYCDLNYPDNYLILEDNPDLDKYGLLDAGWVASGFDTAYAYTGNSNLISSAKEYTLNNDRLIIDYSRLADHSNYTIYVYGKSSGFVATSIPMDDSGIFISSAITDTRVKFLLQRKDGKGFGRSEIAMLKNCVVAKLEHVVSATDPEPTKKIIDILGDSITYGVGANPSTNRYADKLGEYLNATIINHGVSGSKISNVSGDSVPSFLDRKDQISSDANIILVFGGTNDYWHKATNLGDPSSTSESEYNGALNILIEYLQTNHPTAAIYFVTPPNQQYSGSTCDTDHGHGVLKDFRDATLARCSEHGIPVIDLYGISGMDIAHNAKHLAQYSTDGVHPNNAGYDKIARTIAAYLLATPEFSL